MAADRDETRAKLATPGGWGTHGSAIEHVRYVKRITSRRGRSACDCGCRARATHAGMANGLAMTSGCELSMRRWVRDPHAGAAEAWRRHEENRMRLPNSAVRCAVPGCPTPHVRRPEGMNLRTVRARLRAEGWRYVPAHLTTGPARDLCPTHAKESR